MTSTPRSERGEQSTSFEDSGVVRARRDHVLRRGSLTNAPYGRGGRAVSAGQLKGLVPGSPDLTGAGPGDAPTLSLQHDRTS
jgi:hypothetical protein